MSSSEMMHDLPVEEEANVELEDNTPEPEAQDVETNSSDEKPKAKDDAEEYSESVQKRISKLTSRMREAERREKAALDYATSLKTQYDQVSERAKQSDESYLTEYDNRLKVSESTLNDQLKRAIELGDADAQVELSRKLSEHALETQRLEYARERLQTEAPAAEPAAPAANNERQAAPSPKAEEWSAKNEWFGTDEPMTLTAFSIHKQLVQEEHFNPESDSYYEEIDKRMRDTFPHRFEAPTVVEQEVAEPPQQRTSNVAPTGRASSTTRKNGKKSVKLTPSQVAIAKKLGVSLEDYAKQVALLETRSQ